MNYRQGLMRAWFLVSGLWLAITIVWFYLGCDLVWDGKTYCNTRGWPTMEAIFAGKKAEPVYTIAPLSDFSAVDWLWWVALATTLPVFLLLSAGAIMWVWRGFSVSD